MRNVTGSQVSKLLRIASFCVLFAGVFSSQARADSIWAGSVTVSALGESPLGPDQIGVYLSNELGVNDCSLAPSFGAPYNLSCQHVAITDWAISVYLNGLNTAASTNSSAVSGSIPADGNEYELDVLGGLLPTDIITKVIISGNLDPSFASLPIMHWNDVSTCSSGDTSACDTFSPEPFTLTLDNPASDNPNDLFVTDTSVSNTVPEPSTLALTVVGLLVLGAAGRLRKIFVNSSQVRQT